VKLIGSLKQASINAREFLFEKLFSVFGYKAFTLDIIKDIQMAKATFDNAISELIDYLIEDVKNIFMTNQANNATLTSVIRDYVEGLKPTTLNYLFPNEEHKVLQCMVNIDNDENKFIERLAKTVTNLRIEDWTEDTISSFISALEHIKKTIFEYDQTPTHVSSTAPGANSYKISFIGDDGYEVVKSFDKVTFSSRGKLLYNEIATALDEMGKSISDQEKRQILMEFIEKLC